MDYTDYWDLADRHGPITSKVNRLLGRGRWTILAHDFDGLGKHLEGYDRHGWWDRLSIWWGYESGRYPKPPPLHLDPVAIRLGFVPDPDTGRTEEP